MMTDEKKDFNTKLRKKDRSGKIKKSKSKAGSIVTQRTETCGDVP